MNNNPNIESKSGYQQTNLRGSTSPQNISAWLSTPKMELKTRLIFVLRDKNKRKIGPSLYNLKPKDEV